MSQSDQQARQGSSASKKIRMTMACERCRSKKVKCDFAHPSCSRCQQAKAQCSYDGSATQVDLFNLVKLNETVDLLQKRVQSIESDMKNVSTNTQYVADEFRRSCSCQLGHLVCKKPSSSATSSSNGSSPKWSLSLSPNGLRIDTNIISIHTLYDILLSGAAESVRLGMDDSSTTTTTCSHESDMSSQASTSASPAASITTDTASSIDRATITRKKNLWKTKLKAFPLYSTWEPPASSSSSSSNHAAHCQHRHQHYPPATTPAAAASLGGIHTPETMPQETLDTMIDIYSECLLCFPCMDPDNSVAQRYKKGTLDPLLMNVVFAWTARHAAIYHNLFPGKDPNKVGQPFFEKAKELLKDRFMTTSVDTMHSLLIMYIYAIGQPSQQRLASTESEAYIYLGLGIRMCLDMKMYLEPNHDGDTKKMPSSDVVVDERNRRFFWAVYFLETLCTIHSDKAFSLLPEDIITVAYPTVLPHEDGEKRWRVLFTSERFKITRIYRNMLCKTAQEKPLLSSISTLEKDLQDWYEQLPPELRYTRGDIHRRNWASMSFREQACVKLNSEYHFQLCQLYSLFASSSSAPTAGQDPPSSTTSNSNAIELLAQERCLQSADTIVELLECFVRLEQRWCHFSLETLMVSTLVYSRFLNDPSVQADKAAWAHKQLDKMVQVLSTCPVRHHKYIKALVQRIKKLSAQRQRRTPADKDNDDDDELDLNNEEVETETTTLPVTIKMEEEPVVPLPTSEPPAVSSHNSNHHHHQQTMAIANIQQQQEEEPFYPLKDVAAADVMQLSEFLYAPSLINMCGEPVVTDPLLVPSSTEAYDTSSFNPYFTQPYVAPPPPPHPATLFDTTNNHPAPIVTPAPSPFNMVPMHHQHQHHSLHKRPNDDDTYYG